MAFERMADAQRPAWVRSLLIHASGFKGIAKRLRHRNACRLCVRGAWRDAGVERLDSRRYAAAGCMNEATTTVTRVLSA